MTDMTKKEMEAKIDELEKEKETLLAHALQIQTVAQNRLMSLRLLETFVNDVNTAFSKLMRDTQELGLQGQPTEETDGEG